MAPIAAAVWLAVAVVAVVLWGSPRLVAAVLAGWSVGVITFLAARSG